MARHFVPSGLRFFVRQLLDQTVGLHDPVDSCLHGLLPENAIVNAVTEPFVPMWRFVGNGESMMDPTRCPHCNRRLKAVVTDDGRTGLECLKCDAAKPLQTDATRWTESPVVHAKVA